MIRVAIVEDEAKYTEQLESYLQRYEEEEREVFDIIKFSDGDAITDKYSASYDIILMDVQMRFVDGISAAEEIRKIDSEVVIIFITNMRQYALKGYEVDAMDYVLKPISYFAFSQRLKRAIGKRKKRMQKNVIVNIRSGIMRMEVDDIFYVESCKHTLIYHTKTGIYEAYGTMNEAEKNLSEYGFFRGNKGYLINLAHVQGVKESEAIVRGEALLLSRARKTPFMEALTNYWSSVR